MSWNGCWANDSSACMADRKDTMLISEIKRREADLINLYTEAKDASKQFAEAIQFAALHAETTPAVVRRYIAALASEKANLVAHETAQLGMLFDSIPTVTEQVAA